MSPDSLKIKPVELRVYPLKSPRLKRRSGADTSNTQRGNKMNTSTNRLRINIERGINIYVPLPFGKAMNVFIYKHMYLKHMVTIQSRAGALWDYADCGINNYDLLVALNAKNA